MKYQGHQSIVYSMALTSDSKSLYSCSGDGEIFKWNTSTQSKEIFLK